jgi:hypothetical protein
MEYYRPSGLIILFAVGPFPVARGITYASFFEAKLPLCIHANDHLPLFALDQILIVLLIDRTVQSPKHQLLHSMRTIVFRFLTLTTLS